MPSSKQPSSRPPPLVLSPHDPSYPQRVLDLEEPPELTVSGGTASGPTASEGTASSAFDANVRTVAVVGSRNADERGRKWAYSLAARLARAGVVVVSGGAQGIDAAAHEGAMSEGATWCVACTGSDARPFPHFHHALFRRIARSNRSRMIWPFPATKEKDAITPRKRNRVLVALADAVVVIQARIASGSLNAAACADELRRPLYVVTSRPWDWEFQGSRKLIMEGATPLHSHDQLFRDLGLPVPIIRDHMPQLPAIRAFKRRGRSYAPATPPEPDSTPLTAEESRIKSVLSRAPTQQDKIVAKSGLDASSTLTALLTLSLRDVVVEGPDGFFRLRNGS